MRRIRWHAASRGKHHRHVTTGEPGFRICSSRKPSRGALHGLNPSRGGRARQEPRGRHTMTIRTSVTIASIAGAVAALAVIVPVRAGGEKVAFPENHAAGVLFTTVDRADNKQF